MACVRGREKVADNAGVNAYIMHNVDTMLPIWRATLRPQMTPSNLREMAGLRPGKKPADRETSALIGAWPKGQSALRD